MSELPADSASSAPAADKLLAELEDALDRQLARASRDEFEQMLPAFEQLEPLLRRAQALPGPLPAGCAERLQRIRESHRRLQLMLAERRDALAGDLDQLRRGKRMLRTYGRGPASR